MNREYSLLRHFGLDAEALYWGDAHEKYAQEIRDAVDSRRMMGVIGGFGIGKSELVRTTLDEISGLNVIYVNNPDREHLRIGQIISAMVLSLSTEAPKRDTIARGHQISRIVGEKVAYRNQKVVVVIENAHRLHGNTLLALKDLRESTIFKGKAFLFSVILVGQERLVSKLAQYGEVRYRTTNIDLTKGDLMGRDDRISYLSTIYGNVLTKDARLRVAALFPTPLEMDHFIEERLKEAKSIGGVQLTVEDMPMSVKELRNALGVTLNQLSKVTNIPRSSISDVENGKNSDSSKEETLLEALNQIAMDSSSALSRVG